MYDGAAAAVAEEATAIPVTQFLAAVDLTFLSEEQRGATTTVRMLEAEVHTRGYVAAEEVKASVADLLPPATMFGSSFAGPTVLPS